MRFEWDHKAFEQAKPKYWDANVLREHPQTARQMREMSATELAEWSIENGWAPAETVAERDKAIREGISMDAQWWKPQTAGASVAQGCHLCGAKTVKRTTVEKLRSKKVEGEKRWVWETKITKHFECGTVASQGDDTKGRTDVKVGTKCIDISALTEKSDDGDAETDV